MRRAKKILLVGWDSAEWNVIRPLMNQGRLPHLTRLIDQGISGNLRSLHPHHSPMLWTSIATGKRPQKTGICGYREVAPDGLDVRPITSHSRRTKALWNILSQSGLRAHCVNWYASDPAEPINGVHVSRSFFAPSGPANIAGPINSVHPPELEAQLSPLRIAPDELELASLLELLPAGTDVSRLNSPRMRLCASALAETASVHAVACHLLEQHPCDLMTVLHTGLERFSHLLMPFQPPRQPHISEQDFALYQHALSVVYQLHDMMLGRLIELAGPETAVIVLSDHGFKTAAARCDKDAGESIEAAVASHDSQGILVMHGSGIGRDDTIEGATVLDIAPTVLSLLGLPIGTDMDGRPLLSAMDVAPPADTIPSWDAIKSEAWERPRERAVQVDERLRYLYDLGYKESPTADARQRITTTRQENTFNLARACMDAGDTDHAIRLLHSLSRMDPHRADWNKSLFEALNHAGRYTEARAVVDRFWNLGERGPLVHLGYAMIDLSQRRPADALEHLNQIANSPTIIPGMYVLVGQAYLRLRQWELAEKSFHAELSGNSNNELAWGGLAAAAAGRQHYQTAAEQALHAVGLKPDYLLAHYYLGISLHQLGRYPDAAQAFKRCLEIDPDFIAACRGLIALYDQKLGDPTQALVYHQRAADSVKRRRGGRSSVTPAQ